AAALRRGSAGGWSCWRTPVWAARSMAASVRGGCTAGSKPGGAGRASVIARGISRDTAAMCAGGPGGTPAAVSPERPGGGRGEGRGPRGAGGAGGRARAPPAPAPPLGPARVLRGVGRGDGQRAVGAGDRDGEPAGRGRAAAVDG